MMKKQIENAALLGVVLVLMSPFLIIGGLVVIIVAGCLGVPLTAPVPSHLFRQREFPPLPSSATTTVRKASTTTQTRLLESAATIPAR